MLKNKPGARLAIYAVGLIAVGALFILNATNVLNDEAFGAGIGVINTIGTLLGVGAIGTAATNLGRQKLNGTLDVSGTPAEQLAQAVANYQRQRSADEQALASVLKTIPGGDLIAKTVSDTVGAVVDGLQADYR